MLCSRPARSSSQASSSPLPPRRSARPSRLRRTPARVTAPPTSITLRSPTPGRSSRARQPPAAPQSGRPSRGSPVLRLRWPTTLRAATYQCPPMRARTMSHLAAGRPATWVPSSKPAPWTSTPPSWSPKAPPPVPMSIPLTTPSKPLPKRRALPITSMRPS